MASLDAEILNLDDYGLRQRCEALSLSTAGTSSVLRARLRRHYAGDVATPAKGGRSSGPASTLPLSKIQAFLNSKWDSECIPMLEHYIRIPNQSPAFDSQWEANGLLDQAMDLLQGWVEKQTIRGMTVKKLTEATRTPLLLITIPSTSPKVQNTIMMYGHMDKQPPLPPWAEGLAPHTPVIRDGKLYGRGGADDGYSVFSAITSIQALEHAGVGHGKIVIIIEACEESGSADLPHWMQKIAGDLGTPDLIVCLDSGAVSYDRLWITSSLRGLASGVLTVSVLSEGIHSGVCGGLAPDTFRIVRKLISRIEDEETGEILLDGLHVDIPAKIIDQMKVIDSLGDDVMTRDLPFHAGAYGFPGPASQQALANTWEPCLAVIGAAGLPPVETAGNVLRASTSVVLSIRLPPTLEAHKAEVLLKETLERDPPHGAKVTFTPRAAMGGWAAPLMDEWLTEATNNASLHFFEGQPCGLTGCGGSIPFMAMLGGLFPKAQFFITGVLGPKSNAHGPNEFLHIDYTKRVTCCVAEVVAAHFKNASK